MTPEQQAAYIMAMAACAMAEIAGMQAENQARFADLMNVGAHEFRLAFDKTAFEDVITRNGIHHNQIIGMFTGR